MIIAVSNNEDLCFYHAPRYSTFGEDNQFILL